MVHITNLEFFPTLLVMLTWAIAVSGLYILARVNPLLANVTAPVAFIIISMWGFRARHNFGRSVSRGYFDEIDILQLPPRTGDVALWDPPTLVEHTKEEHEEEKKEKEELSKAMAEGFELPANEGSAKSETKSKTDQTPKSSSSFKKRQEQHYANEFAIAKQLFEKERQMEEEKKKRKAASGGDFKKRQQDHYANEFARAKQFAVEMKQREEEEKQKRLMEKSKEDFNKKQKDHYANEFSRAKELQEKERQEKQEDETQSDKSELVVSFKNLKKKKEKDAKEKKSE